MRSVLSILTIVLTANMIYAADFTDYKAIAVASPLINQIYINPELSDVEDMELVPDNEIGLYERLSDEICKTLTNRFEDEIEFICYGNIQDRLDDEESWNDFNRYFTGSDQVAPDIGTRFADKLQAGATLNTSLIFSYYANSRDKRHLEAHFEWYLIDLKSGELVVDGKYDCEDDFEISPELINNEFHCFTGIIDLFAELDENR